MASATGLRSAPKHLVSSRGLIKLKSPYTVADTVRRLLDAFAAKNIKVFAVIDQQAEAQAVGLALPATTLIVFGNPKAGTALMLANPESGIDLPLKVLVCESLPHQVEVMLIAAAQIVERHALPPELAANLQPAERLIAAILHSDDARIR